MLVGLSAITTLCFMRKEVYILPTTITYGSLWNYGYISD